MRTPAPDDGETQRDAQSWRKPDMLTMDGEKYSIVLLREGEVVQQWNGVRIATCQDGIVICDVAEKLHIVDLEEKIFRKFGGDDDTFDELKISTASAPT